MGTGRSDDPFFDHFDDFLYDLMPNKFLAVSYTHLTLPTIYSV